MSKKPRGIWVSGNWKMNHGPAATQAYFSELKSLLNGFRPSGALKSLLFPPMLSLTEAKRLGAELGVEIGCQNVNWEKSGAFTGEVSGPMIREIGIEHALVGHSERRQHFGETDETCFKRTASLLAQGFQVMLCIGETRSEREAGQTEAVVLRQLKAVLEHSETPVREYLDGRLTLAYEPVWAIGTGLTATPEQAEQAHAFIRQYLSKTFGPQASEKTRILYGGSVTPDNFASLLACPNVDGGLVGGASVQAKSYSALLQTAREFV